MMQARRSAAGGRILTFRLSKRRAALVPSMERWRLCPVPTLSSPIYRAFDPGPSGGRAPAHQRVTRLPRHPPQPRARPRGIPGGTRRRPLLADQLRARRLARPRVRRAGTYGAFIHLFTFTYSDGLRSTSQNKRGVARHPVQHQRWWSACHHGGGSFASSACTRSRMQIAAVQRAARGARQEPPENADRAATPLGPVRGHTTRTVSPIADSRYASRLERSSIFLSVLPSGPSVNLVWPASWRNGRSELGPRYQLPRARSASAWRAASGSRRLRLPMARRSAGPRPRTSGAPCCSDPPARVHRPALPPPHDHLPRGYLVSNT